MKTLSDSELYVDLEEQLIARSKRNRLNAQDRQTLNMLVQQYRNYLIAIQSVHEDGILVRSTNTRGEKTVKQNPAVTLQAASLDNWMKLLRYFQLEYRNEDTGAGSDFGSDSRPGG